MKASSTVQSLSEEYLKEWSQGDCFFNDEQFIFTFDPTAPASAATKALVAEMETPDATEELQIGSEPVDEGGWVLISQTCDVVRSASKRPYVCVAPLVKVNSGQLRQVQKKWQLRFAEVPGVSNRLLVADLERIMTLEKPVLAKQVRVPGCNSDNQRRDFAEALQRKFSRPALPDKFGELVKPMRDNWNDIFGKDTEEARVLDIIGEVRAKATPAWDSETVDVHLWFLIDPYLCKLGDTGEEAVEATVQKWIGLLKPEGTKYSVQYRVEQYKNISALELISSDKLDFDNLS